MTQMTEAPDLVEESIRKYREKKRREYQRAYYQSHKEALDAYHEAYRKLHREQQLSYQREYYQKNKERISAKRREIYAARKKEKEESVGA